jgi:galactokinase
MDVAERFAAAFRHPPAGVWAAPGRVNLIGEHTDYNDGFVLPLALRQRVLCAASAREDGRLVALSAQAPGVTVDVVDAAPGSVPGWGGYVAGVLWALSEAGHAVGGLEVSVDGDLPLGAGLSSSAALSCAVGLACAELFGLAGLSRSDPAQEGLSRTGLSRTGLSRSDLSRTGLSRTGLSRTELARAAQRAENDFVGAPVGIMDQMAVLHGRSGHALLLDTRSLEITPVQLRLGEHGLALLVIDTKAPHRLVDGEYTARRRSCELAAAALGVPALRDATASVVEELADAELRRRAWHVVTENARVHEVAAVLRDGGDPRAIGPALTASHASLRDDFEVSCAELDTAVDAALAAGAHGARMTGGGFGGCAIALVDAPAVPVVAAAVAAAFAARGLTAPAWFLAEPSDGATRLA